MLNKPSPLHGLRAREAIEALLAQVVLVAKAGIDMRADAPSPAASRHPLPQAGEEKKERARIEARISELTKQNNAAPAWGGAVGARCEEIRALQASLSALNQKEGV